MRKSTRVAFGALVILGALGIAAPQGLAMHTPPFNNSEGAWTDPGGGCENGCKTCMDYYWSNGTVTFEGRVCTNGQTGAGQCHCDTHSDTSSMGATNIFFRSSYTYYYCDQYGDACYGVNVW